MLDRFLKDEKGNKALFIIIGVVFFLFLVGGIASFIYFKKFLPSKKASLSGGIVDTSVMIGNSSSHQQKLVNAPSSSNSSGALVNSGACAAPYEKLLSANKFDFEKYCTNSKVRTGEYQGGDLNKKTNHMVLVFDASGSMAAKIGGKRKIDIAKDAAKNFIEKARNDEDFELSIVVYGHKGSNSASQKGASCAGIEEVYYMGKVNSELAKSKLDTFDATGWTPIAQSFRVAKDILNKKPGTENYILLVSDGKETCGGDPVATARELSGRNLHITANVIGFDVGGQDEQQLKSIAQAGGGEYFSVKNQQDLEAAFEKHKEKLNEVNFKIGRTIEQLYDMSSIKNSYVNCLGMLKREETSMMLDIHASKLSGNGCESYADAQYKKRFTEMKKRIEDNYRNDMATFEQLK